MLATMIDPVGGARLFMVFALTKILKFLRRAYTQESAFVTDNHTLSRRSTTRRCAVLVHAVTGTLAGFPLAWAAI